MWWIVRKMGSIPYSQQLQATVQGTYCQCRPHYSFFSFSKPYCLWTWHLSSIPHILPSSSLWCPCIKMNPCRSWQELWICLSSTTDGKDKAKPVLSPLSRPQTSYRNLHPLLALSENMPLQSWSWDNKRKFTIWYLIFIPDPGGVSSCAAVSLCGHLLNGKVLVPRKGSGDNENINRLIGNISFQFSSSNSSSTVDLLYTPQSRKTAVSLSFQLITDLSKWYGCGRQFQQENLEIIYLVTGWHFEDFLPALEVRTIWKVFCFHFTYLSLRFL